MTWYDVLAIAGATAALIGALSSAAWVWFSHKSRGPMAILEKKLREAWHTEVGRIEERAVDRHKVLCNKLDRLDREITAVEKEISSVKTIAIRADGKAESALRDLDKRNSK